MVNISPPSTRRAGIRDYLKSAFLYRWNLLLFVGGVAASVLSPRPDALLPLVAAAEAFYLGGLVASAKFRHAVDAQLHQAAQQPVAAAGQRTLQQVIAALPVESRRRFEELRGRCLEMRAIASGVRGETGPDANASDDWSAGALDRLLWVFLRLLVSQEALKRFLARTTPDEIRARLEETRARLAAGGDDERLKRSLEDSAAAHQLRLDNHSKAVKNADFVRVELDRIEAKIHALTEASVNRQDTEFLSSQIDSVTQSMQSTEQAISELQHITGLVDEMQEPPAILTADLGGGEGRR